MILNSVTEQKTWSFMLSEAVNLLCICTDFYFALEEIGVPIPIETYLVMTMVAVVAVVVVTAVCVCVRV